MLRAFSHDLKTPRTGRFSLEQALAAGGAALLALSWLTTEHFPPWVSWHSEALAFFAVFLVAWTAAVACWRETPSQSVRLPLLALPFALFGAVALAQILGDVMTFWGDVLVVWFYAALCVTCLILGFNTAVASDTGPASGDSAPWGAPVWLALAFVVGSIASVIVACAQVFDLWEHSAQIVRMAELRRPGGNLGQPNQLATLLVMGIASTAFLHLSGKFTGRVTVLILLVLGAGLAATESRTGVLGLGALLLWWQLKRRTIADNVTPWAAPTAGLIFVAMFLAWPQLLNSMQLLEGRAQSRFSQGDVRLAMWSQLFEAVWQRPWWGWGIAEVAEAHNSVAHAHAVNNPFSYSHNLLMDWAVWMGLPLAIALTLVTALWLWRRARAARELTPWYCLAVAVPLATHSMFEFPFAYAYFLAPVMFLLGVLEASLRIKPLLRISPMLAVVPLSLVSVAMLWSVSEYFAIEEDFRIVRFEQLRIGRTQSDHRRPDAVLMTQLGTLLSGSRVDLKPNMAAEEMDQLKKLALRYPWVATQYRYGLALALNGEQMEAIRQFQVIRRQRGEKTYQSIKREIAELPRSRYPQLGTLVLP